MRMTVLPRFARPHAAPDSDPPRPRRAWLAALLSFLWPGLGQLYNGRMRRGLVLLGLGAVGQLMSVAAAESFHWWAATLAAYLLLALYAAWEAYRTAHGLNGFYPGPANRGQLYAACVVGLTTVSLLSGALERWAYPEYTVRQTSMRPTLRSGDRLRCRALRPREVIRRGQLVVLEYSSERPLVFVMRVVGLPGEVVEVEDGLVYVNGDPIDEGTYASRGAAGRSLDTPPTRLDPGFYFVMGDNRHAAFDSRSFGPVSRARMLATPLYVVASVDEQGRVRWDRTGLPAR